MVSNPFNNWRADGLILYGRRVARAHNATAAQLFGESTGRAASGNEVLDPSVVLVSLERYPLSGAFDRHLCSWLSGRVDISWY